MRATRGLAVFAALNGAVAVAIGAFAAHAADPQIRPLLATCGQYLMVHALLALVCALWPGQRRLAAIAGWLAATGGLVFCLALLALGLMNLRFMGAVAPVGGVLMISAWLLLAVTALRSQTVTA